jgi:hypothetical protein
MKFCKAWVSKTRQRVSSEQTLRASVVVALACAGVIASVACSRRGDPGFDIVAVPSAAYLAMAPDAGHAAPDAGAREAGTVTVASVKCEERSEDEDFEPNDEISVCPNENADGWPLDTRTTTRHREDREEDVCCFKRPSGRKIPAPEE